MGTDGQEDRVIALLAGKHYDPAVAVSKSTASLLAMTAFDTSNLRLTFTAPANGSVLVRIRCVESGATTFPDILLGVLSGASVIARQAPIGSISGTAATTTGVTHEAVFTVTGLSGSQTWDAAYGVETIVASTNIHYGGPNDTTANNAWGGFIFEVYDAPNLLGSIRYDPATAVQKSTAALLAMTAFDTTNLRITFTAPTSTNISIRARCVLEGSTTYAQVLIGVLEGATVVGRGDPIGGLVTTALATGMMTQEAEFAVLGISAGSHTYDLAYGVETLVASTNINYGGPNDTTANNAYGHILFEVWSI
jgi:hypothetical protein